MPRFARTLLVIGLLCTAATAEAQWAVGHRIFGAGTSMGLGFARQEYQFPGIEPNQLGYLLPTIELKFFFTDTISLDLSVPVVNIATSNALDHYFRFTADVYLNFHPSAPSSFELFVAPGFGVTYAAWKDTDKGLEDSGYAFHIPVRVGMEFNNAKRNFSAFIAVRPFFSLMHNTSTKAGGGVLVEAGFMAYAVRYFADRY